VVVEVTGADAFGNACPLPPEAVSLECQPHDALTDVVTSQGRDSSVVVVTATAASQGGAPNSCPLSLPPVAWDPDRVFPESLDLPALPREHNGTLRVVDGSTFWGECRSKILAHGWGAVASWVCVSTVGLMGRAGTARLAVRGEPVSEPWPVSAPAAGRCSLAFLGQPSAVAGERAVVMVEARDAAGERIRTVPARLLFRI
jgi:hypothetical protein